MATTYYDYYNNATLSDFDATNDGLIMSTTEISYEEYSLRPETYLVPIVFAIFFIVGSFGNFTLIVIFLINRNMRNIPNTYIVSLAFADLLVILITVPIVSIVYTLDSWPWGSIMCTITEFIKDVSIGVSVFTLTVLASERFFAIVEPLRRFNAHGGGKNATFMTIVTVICIWILAIICGIPAIIGSNIRHARINKNVSFSYCYPFPEEWGESYAQSIVLARFLIYYAIPLLIISVFYILIASHLIHSANVPGEIHHNTSVMRQVRARKKVAIAVLTFVILFGVCFFPYHLFMLWFYYNPHSQDDYNTFWHVLRIISFCLSFANSCVNPIALYFVSAAFRKHFRRCTLCCIGRGHQNNDLHLRETSVTSTISRRYPSSKRVIIKE